MFFEIIVEPTDNNLVVTSTSLTEWNQHAPATLTVEYRLCAHLLVAHGYPELISPKLEKLWASRLEELNKLG